VAHVVNIGERLEAKGVSLKVLEQSIDKIGRAHV